MLSFPPIGRLRTCTPLAKPWSALTLIGSLALAGCQCSKPLQIVAPPQHPDAIKNTHAPGEVDRPELVPFVVPFAQSLPGFVLDDADAILEGEWQYSTHTPPYVGYGYLHDQKSGKGKKSVTYSPTFKRSGIYELRISHCYNIRRSTNTLVQVQSASGLHEFRINQQQVPEHDRLFRTLGRFRFHMGNDHWIKISNKGTEGKYVIADAIQLLEVSTEH